MWVWLRRLLRAKPPQADAGVVIPDRLQSPPPPPPPAESAAESVKETLKTTEETLAERTGVAADVVKTLISEAGQLDRDLAMTIRAVHQQAADVFSGDVAAAYQLLKSTVGSSPDVIVRKFDVGRKNPIPAVLIFIDGLVDNQIVDQDTVALAQAADDTAELAQDPSHIAENIATTVVSVGHTSTETQWSKALVKAMGGNTVVFFQGCPTMLVLDSVKYPARPVGAAKNEQSVKGSQEAFNEVILTSMNLIRRRIRTPALRFTTVSIGNLTEFSVAMAHIEGVANAELVMAVKRRLAHANIDAVENSSTLKPFLVAHPLSVFPQIRSSERVDVICRNLLEGKVAVMVDNDPFLLTLPSTFMDFYQTAEDYALSFWEAGLTRLARLIGLLVGLFIPPLYIALVVVNPDLLPTKLAISISGTSVGIPMPPVAQVILLWMFIEIFREATIRLPKNLSVAIGTFGAIIVGTAVVKAGLVTDILIVGTTLSALGLFATPAYEMATPWRVLLWVEIIASQILGLYGIMLASICIIAYLCGIENYGVPYLSPFGPVRLRDLQDSWVRFPRGRLVRRPVTLHPFRIRQIWSDPAQRPVPRPHLHATQVRRLRHDDT